MAAQYPYPPPPQQQQQQQQVVIVNQPAAAAGPSILPIHGTKEWSTGLCGCFEDISSCCYAYFCFPCFLCTLASEMGECALGPCCLDRLFMTAMRTKVRTMHGIKGTICNDICCIWCCQFCATLQMHRELKNYNQA